MKLKYFLSLLLITALMLTLPLPVLASGGEGNIDGGGGGMGSGHEGNYWNGEDGVRISVVRTNGTTVAALDWSNYNVKNIVQISFGKRNKLEYKGGYTLTPKMDSYSCTTPSAAMPRIVSTSGSNNIEAIKRYFTDSGHLAEIAREAGMSYDDLVGGDYKLLLEPMAYYVFGGMMYAATATETALLDIQMNGNVWYWLRSLTHQNLPLAMFLEKADDGLGLRKWTGATSGKQTNLDIINYLGMGVVTFKEQPQDNGGGSDYDYEFHCNTDVIVSFPIYSPSEITPDDNAYVTLNVGGTNYHRQFVCPAGGTQLIWVRWHTPSTPQELTMTATGAGNNVTLRVKVSALEENPPPDPTYYDSGSGFTLAATPNYGSNLLTSWGEWYATWIQNHGTHLGGCDPVWDWVEDGEDEDGNPKYKRVIVDYEPWYYTCTGYCREHGYWTFDYTTYTARLTANFAVEPDDRVQTDYTSARYSTVMKSGYGVQAKVTANVSRGAGVDSYDVTPVQNVVATFPEFNYQTYNRFLELDYGAIWKFKQNQYSHYASRIHFTPLWYPDDTYYPVAFCAFDCWTPGGQLYASGSDAVYIFESCLDDWVIHLVE